MAKKSKSDIVHELVAESLAKKKAERHQDAHEEHKKVKLAEKPHKIVKASAKKQPQQNLAPDKLVLLITIVNRQKTEYFLDLIESFHSNMQMSFSASGTASRALGLLTPDAEKEVIFSVLTRENAKLALYTLNKKFESIRGGKGIALTVPMTSTIGVAIYCFLSNRAQ